jgi:hypothetical protein
VCANANGMLDTRTYEIEFPYGRIGEYTANIITENMYAQCDEEGNQFKLMWCIVDHNIDGHAVDSANMYIKHGINRQASKTNKGWHFCDEWKDATISWE